MPTQITCLADVTPVALEWAQRNLQKNPQLSEGIEVRSAVGISPEVVTVNSGNQSSCPINSERIPDGESHNEEGCHLPHANRDQSLDNPPVQADEEALPAIGGGDEEHSEDLSVNVVHPAEQQDHNSDSREGGRLEAGSEGDVGNDPPGSASVLVGVIKDGEKFDFCMCNPPFFEDIQEAGLNPRTACGGTVHEMVYPGGELAFITQIVRDSLQLRKDIQ